MQVVRLLSWSTAVCKGGSGTSGVRRASVFARERKRALPKRIRPAVGDQGQKFAIQEQTESTQEKDSDWVLVQNYVRELNPRILNEAQNVRNIVLLHIDDACLCKRRYAAGFLCRTCSFHVFSAWCPLLCWRRMSPDASCMYTKMLFPVIDPTCIQ